MELPSNPFATSDIQTLRIRLKAKYNSYHQADPVRFPRFDYNTNRVNYEPLRNAFEHEFFIIRSLERSSPTIHIPSTTTLSLLFTNDQYSPGKKIENTCWSFADGPGAVEPEPGPAIAAKPITADWFRKPLWLGAGALLLLGLAGFAGYSLTRPRPSAVRLLRPEPNGVVQQATVVAGLAEHASLIWLVVHPANMPRYWVQQPIYVNPDGWWVGAAFVGGTTKENEGLTFEIRAFVNPTAELHTEQMLTDWPEAELSSAVVRVTRAVDTPKPSAPVP